MMPVAFSFGRKYMRGFMMILWVVFCLSIIASAASLGFPQKCDQEDVEALLDFKSALLNPEILSSWNKSIDCCSWEGIVCKSNAAALVHRVEQLLLPGKNLKGPVLPSLSNITALSTLDLSGNLFFGSLPTQIFSLQRLQTLNLSCNNFSGSVSELNMAAQLVHLNLSHNVLNGSLPALRNLGELRYLDVSSNYLSGSIPEGICWEGSNLLLLDLSNNDLDGMIPESLKKCTRLEFLMADENRLEGPISRQVTSLISLKHLSLSCNRFSGQLSSGLVNLSKLEVLVLSNNELNGTIPEEIGKLRSLKALCLSYNNFEGHIPRSLSDCSSLELLSIRNNYLEGFISLDFQKLTTLSVMDLSYNQLSGSIPSSLSSCSLLEMLGLAGNNLTGWIPRELGGLKSLVTLSLSGNSLTGKIPSELAKCENLVSLVLSKNVFTEPLPENIRGFSNLQLLAIGNSNLTGPIPNWLINCTKLQVLDLSWNHLTGELPEWLGEFNHLFYLDLSNNSLSGRIPVGLSSMKSLQAEDRNASGLQPVANTLFVKHKLNSSALQYNQVSAFPPSILLSNNDLSGEIPPQLGMLKKLVALELSNNHLIGIIPETLGNATDLESLDFSQNDLSGLIPQGLVQLTFLSHFNVSYNNLMGPIPLQNQFASFTNISYLGNTGLCGPPLNKSCTVASSVAPSTAVLWRTKKLNTSAVMGITISVGIGLTGLFGTMLLLLLSRRRALVEGKDDCIKEYEISQKFNEALSLTIDVFHNKDLKQVTLGDILRATNNFDHSNIIGCGGFGLVFKANLADGSKVAIKKLTGDCLQMEREFEAEVQTLGKANHPNLVRLQGYCKYGTDRLLVYSYMENGSLDYWLHERTDGGHKLDWPIRLKIAQGAAHGLAYLHQECDPHIVHRDIKSSNILLDDKFKAHVADFGLARLMLPSDTHVTTELVGTLGYIPPEYGQSLMATLRGDVYSFGVLILEILSRIRPVDVCRPRGVRDLVAWVRQVMKEGNPMDIFDPLLRNKGYDSQMLQVLEVACFCINLNAQKRPCIQAVVSWLEKVGCDFETSK